MNAEGTLLAIDLGTSGPKVALFSQQGELLSNAFHPVGLHLLPGGGAEQNPDEWWAAICSAVRQALADCPLPPESVSAVCCTSQWSGTVAVDRDGRHLMPAIIWMDSRGAPYVRRITAGVPNIAGFGLTKLLTWLRYTGGIPGLAGKDSIAHILFIQNQRPEVYQAAYKFLEPKDYLNLRLTGRFAASTDSIALHWLADTRDLSSIDYQPALLELSGVERDKLPDLLAPSAILGPLCAEAASDLGLSTDVPVVMGTPDLQSAALGSGGIEDYAAHLYIGTSSWLACHVPFKKTDVLHNIASLPSAMPDRYLVSNEQQSAGACVNYLKDQLLFPGGNGCRPPDEPYEYLNRLAANVHPGSCGVIFTPWLYGERTPVDDRALRGGFFNLSLDCGQAHMVRAVFEGVAYNSRWLLNYVEKFARQRLEPVRLVGGGAQSALWCQIHADVLGREIWQIEHPLQVNTRGAAVLAAVALGWTDFHSAAHLARPAQVYRPNQANRALYDDLYREFLGIYRRNRKAYTRLNG